MMLPDAGHSLHPFVVESVLAAHWKPLSSPGWELLEGRAVGGREEVGREGSFWKRRWSVCLGKVGGVGGQICRLSDPRRLQATSAGAGLGRRRSERPQWAAWTGGS